MPEASGFRDPNQHPLLEIDFAPTYGNPAN
jgi:hypothetical protein